MSSAYHPQTDGQSEAMNRVVEMILRCIMHENKEMEHWETILAIVEFVVNNSPAQSTRYTPFYLNYGYHPTVPSDLIDGNEVTRNEFLNEFN